MPIYEYRCTECRTIIEEIQKFSDEPLTDCKECDITGTLEKIITGTHFSLKGDCWYKDGYTHTEEKK
jgi:putative FmdB family regulatory protein